MISPRELRRSCFLFWCISVAVITTVALVRGESISSLFTSEQGVKLTPWQVLLYSATFFFSGVYFGVTAKWSEGMWSQQLKFAGWACAVCGAFTTVIAIGELLGLVGH